MSMINDYTVQRLSTQRQHDLALEAANRRLVRLAKSGRRPWWQRLQEAGRRVEGSSARPVAATSYDPVV